MTRLEASRLSRLLLALSGVAATWGVWVLVLVLHGSGWLMAASAVGMWVSSVGLAVAIYACVREEEPPAGGGDTGGARYLGPESPRGGGDSEPPWWPEFERELASYMAERALAQYSPSPRV